MRFYKIVSRFLLLLMLLVYIPAAAKVNVLRYDSSVVINAAMAEKAAVQATDSVLRAHPMLEAGRYVTREHRRIFTDKTFDFYLILGLLIMLGVMRFANPRYFQNLFKAFRSPGYGAQQMKEKMGGWMLYNLFMNFFFALSAGVYVYYVFKFYMPQRYAIYSPSLLISVLIISFVGLYGAKYAVLRFSGWAFNVRVIIGHYMYNVFLINKIIAIAVLPFTILLAFAQPELGHPAIIVSLFLVALLFTNRYIRSWQVLGSFFQYSKFHFFTYLCASEILPMAVLAKLLIRGMYY